MEGIQKDSQYAESFISILISSETMFIKLIKWK
ncbi:hypothetical protein T08_6422 [Trichinella sp. T8]|nr:hypothetical protein T08_328 [Trichinella sp. T8]KRZ70292.1 hypothetical protein T08_6422 [Trichinella sp. T8]